MPLTVSEVDQLIRSKYPEYVGGSQFKLDGQKDGYILNYGRDRIDNSTRLKAVYNPLTEGTQYYLDGIAVTGATNESGVTVSWHAALEGQTLTEDQAQAALGYGPLYLQAATHVPDWNAALKAADNGGGWVELATNLTLGAIVSAAAVQAVGALSPDGFSLGAEATEEITVSMTETTGANTVGETGMEWYSVDPGPDPFYTTADVNAGWSFDGGYAGVDWYNSAGVGEINAADSSLWDIFGKATTAVKQGLGAVVAASGALQATRNNLAKPVPNYTRAAGGINVGLLAVGLLAWKLL